MVLIVKNCYLDERDFNAHSFVILAYQKFYIDITYLAGVVSITNPSIKQSW